MNIGQTLRTSMHRLFFILLLALASCSTQKNHSVSSNTQGAPSKLISSVYFDEDKTEIKDFNVIRHNAQWLKANLNKVIILEGYCDEQGSHEYNLRLGDQRSRVVMKALMEQGVSEKQLIIMSYGKSRSVPGAKNHAQNRRVYFAIR